MAFMRSTAKSGICRNGIRMRGLFLLGASLFAGTAGSSVLTCASTQRVPVTDSKPWRCQVDLQANRAYLAEATRQRRDVTLELLGPDASRVLKVDSPTVRAGPEFLFFSPRVSGKYSLVIAAADRDLPTRTIEVQWRELSDVAPGSALARGLTDLTSAARVSDGPPPRERGNEHDHADQAPGDKAGHGL